jgi:arylsulfatase A-like enzyme
MDPPEPYCDLYDYDEVELPPNYAVKLDGSPRETTAEEDAAARRFVAHYWALVRLIDDQVARIVKALEETGQLENTLIVFVSDHGEMLFERGCTAKGRHFDPIIRTPLIIVPPKDVERAPTVSGVVEAFDIAPTILDYARAGVPGNMSAHTLRPIIEEGAPTQGHALCQQMAHDQSWKTISLTTERYRYIWSNTPDRPERFFDLEADPIERTNFLDEAKYANEIDRHRRLMIDRLSVVS